jgi:hypothetical protein
LYIKKKKTNPKPKKPKKLPAALVTDEEEVMIGALQRA